MQSQEMLIELPSEEREETIIKWVRKWGEVNTDGLLDATCKYFFMPGIEGFIGYRIESGHAVVLGDPVCASQDKGPLALAFQQFCEDQKLGVVYTIVSEEFAHWGAEHLSGVLIEFGEKFVLDPLHNPVDNTGSRAGLVRKKIKHAVSDHVEVEEYLGDSPSLQRQIEQVAETWLKGRKGPQVYLSHIKLFQNRLGKRWFYAHVKGKVVGVLVLNELQSHSGWLMNHLMATKEAPAGTSELLVISALQALNKERCRFVLVGPVPADELGKIAGLGALSASLTRFLFKCAKKIFPISGHGAFWIKFQPTSLSSYLLFPKNNMKFSSVKALLKAFNVGS